MVTFPEVVIRPIELLSALVNHSAPSGPAVIAVGPLMPGLAFGHGCHNTDADPVISATVAQQS